MFDPAAYKRSYAETTTYCPPAPKGLEYRNYQRAAIEWCVDYPQALIADPAGVGKTISAIGAMNALRTENILIVCPAIVKDMWYDVTKQWYMNENLIQIVEGKDSPHKKAAVCIVSQDVIARPHLVEAFRGREPSLLIVDEIHNYQSINAKRTLALLGPDGIAAKCKRHIVLSGTPMADRPVGLFPTLASLSPDTINPHLDYYAYTKRYCGGHKRKFGWYDRGVSHAEELRTRLRSGFMIRRPKSVANIGEAPPRNIVAITLSKKDHREIVELEGVFLPDKISKKLKAQDFTNTKPDDVYAATKRFGEMSALRSELMAKKLKPTLQYIEGLLDDPDEKLLLFVHHRESAAMLDQALEKYSPAIIIGGQTKIKRSDCRKKFADDPECRILIANIAAAGTGLDGLQHTATSVLFAETDWSATAIDQAISRVWRSGMKQNPTVSFMTIRNTLDEYMLQNALGKEKSSNFILS